MAPLGPIMPSLWSGGSGALLPAPSATRSIRHVSWVPPSGHRHDPLSSSSARVHVLRIFRLFSQGEDEGHHGRFLRGK